MLTFRANASCKLSQEDLKWASLGRESNGDMGNVREGDLFSFRCSLSLHFHSGHLSFLCDLPFFLHSPFLARPKLAHFKSSWLSLQEALARNVNIII